MPQPAKDPNAKCPICGKPVEGFVGAKVYHFSCAFAQIQVDKDKK